MEAMKIACVQMNCAMGERDANLAKIIRYSQEAAADGVSIICFPELSITGSLYEGAYNLAETIPGPSSEALGPVARRHNITIIAGTCERGKDGVVYNSLVLAFPDGRIERFRKLYIPEGEYPFFRQGAEVPVFQIPGCTFAVSVCADLNFAELYKLMAVKGAEVIFNANGGGRRATYGELLPVELQAASMRDDRASYENFLKFFSVTNAVYYFMCNQVGYSTHPTLRGKWFPGIALVANPGGEIIASSDDPREEAMITVQLDPALFAEKRQRLAFALRKRRSDILEELARLS
ncbi:MAG: hypothetical protein EXR62_14305 [Chloroflexi bacterium]|nr:hypothetical protein [Chloroflexota bacterium]